ncbi:hypothetical protein FQZ97_929730 [compost metagenome]
MLVAHGNGISAASLVRLQFEALVRGMWVWYAASDEAIEKLLAPVSTESLQKASDLPGVSVMLKALAKAEGIPQMAVEMLVDFKERLLNELHSLVHSGFLPYKLHELGEIVEINSIITKTVRHSNGLVTMAGMMMALLSGEESVITPMTKIQHQFKDCLPELIAPNESH